MSWDPAPTCVQRFQQQGFIGGYVFLSLLTWVRAIIRLLCLRVVQKWEWNPCTRRFLVAPARTRCPEESSLRQRFQVFELMQTILLCSTAANVGYRRYAKLVMALLQDLPTHHYPPGACHKLPKPCWFAGSERRARKMETSILWAGGVCKDYLDCWGLLQGSIPPFPASEQWETCAAVRFSERRLKKS